jgi:hypothetical protein
MDLTLDSFMLLVAMRLFVGVVVDESIINFGYYYCLLVELQGGKVYIIVHYNTERERERERQRERERERKKEEGGKTVV